MKKTTQLTLAQAADYLETATIEKTIDVGHSVIHRGTSTTGVTFTLINNAAGETTLTENM